MSEWQYGCYFSLEGEVKVLFQWLNKHCGDDWSVSVSGFCSIENNLILNTRFHHEEEFKQFKNEFAPMQSNYSSIYHNRRKPDYKWPFSAERRKSQERRTDKHRRSPKRDDSRRLDDIIWLAFNNKANTSPATLTAAQATR